MPAALTLVALLVVGCTTAVPVEREPRIIPTTAPPPTTPTSTTTSTTTTSTTTSTTTTEAPEELPAVLVAIAECESGGDPRARNPRSSAAGKFQFLSATWASTEAGDGYPSADVAPEHVQDAAAVELHQRSGTRPWAASAGCWTPTDRSRHDP